MNLDKLYHSIGRWRAMSAAAILQIDTDTLEKKISMSRADMLKELDITPIEYAALSRAKNMGKPLPLVENSQVGTLSYFLDKVRSDNKELRKTNSNAFKWNPYDKHIIDTIKSVTDGDLVRAVSSIYSAWYVREYGIRTKDPKQDEIVQTV